MRMTIPALTLALAGLLTSHPAHGQDPSAVAVAEGARVWADNCTRCHNARPSQERTDAQWRTIVLHMRARANLTRSDAEVVTSFLQATNLSEQTAARVDPEPEKLSGAGTGDSPEAARLPTVEQLTFYLRLLASRGSG